MSYNTTLQCGCIVYVACDPQTRIAHTRVIERRGRHCATRTHEVGLHLRLWELLPDSSLTRRGFAPSREAFSAGLHQSS